MENEQTPSPSSYTVPETENLTPDQAASALSKFYGEARSDKQHPHNDHLHPQHGEFIDAVTKLHGIKTPEPPAQIDSEGQELSNPIPHATFQAMGEALDDKAGRNEATQEKLRVEMRREIEQINNLWEGTDIDFDEALENATPEKLEGYKQMAQLARGDYAGLGPKVIADYQKLGVQKPQLDVLRQFFDTVIPGDALSQDLANLLIRHSYKNKKQLAERFSEHPTNTFGLSAPKQTGSGRNVDDYDRLA